MHTLKPIPCYTSLVLLCGTSRSVSSRSTSSLLPIPKDGPCQVPVRSTGSLKVLDCLGSLSSFYLFKVFVYDVE